MLSSKDVNFVGYTYKNYEIVNDDQLPEIGLYIFNFMCIFVYVLFKPFHHFCFIIRKFLFNILLLIILDSFAPVTFLNLMEGLVLYQFYCTKPCLFELHIVGLNMRFLLLGDGKIYQVMHLDKLAHTLNVPDCVHTLHSLCKCILPSIN